MLVLVTQVHLASAADHFTLETVLQQVIDKVTRRHPHIFGEAKAATAEEALQVWQTAKQQETGAPASILDGIPPQLPALMRADEMQQRAARVGFDWPDIEGVAAKVHEEVDELTAASTADEEIEELGDLLFALVNLARRKGFSAEHALRQANEKFQRRFAAIESECTRRGARPQDLGLQELDRIWEQVKTAERLGEP